MDSYENKVPSGRVYGLHPEKGIGFRSAIELLEHIDSALEETNCPQAFSTRRVFWSKKERKEPEAVSGAVKKGKIATFALRILFRQNASWQGTVSWLERRSEESFRSVLELLLLMDSALDCTEENEDALTSDGSGNLRAGGDGD